MNFTEQDINQIQAKKLTVAEVENQIATIALGKPFVNLFAAATYQDGILKLTEAKQLYFVKQYDAERSKHEILKFVPASGAATRMFKSLFKFCKTYNPETETVNAFVNRENDKDLSLFFIAKEKLPFHDAVMAAMAKFYPDYKQFGSDKFSYSYVKTMLDTDKLNYGFFPKGLLPFHKYKEHIATAFEEHLFEAALYASSEQKSYLHFTISEHHKDVFDDEFKRIQNIVEHKTDTKFFISFSYQKEATDTIALTLDNKPFRLDDQRLLFRPSGHGALLANLNEMDADIIFIKNIDNVVVFKYEQDVATYKKALAGLLLEVQKKAFNYLNLLENPDVSEALLVEIANFLINDMQVKISSEFEKYALKYQIEYLKNKLHRPIRVCGMVKNEGEPGGGPFWVKDESGNLSLQIVESAQIDKKNKHQLEIVKQATHFNPVDLVCGIKDYKGNPFNLENYVDPKTAFITRKTKNGKALKALELPGLWNGSMANWNTIFVEVPLITFNPVKTATDLLKPTHQVN